MKTIDCFLGIILLLAPLAAFAAGDQTSSGKHGFLVYVGTYTGGPEAGVQTLKSKGIYVYRYDAAAGRWTSLGVAAETTNPSFLAVDPSRRYLYAVNELADYGGPNSGGVSAFSLDRSTGKLAFLNEVATRGADPCFVSFDKTGKYALVANYTGGSVAVFPVRANGRVGQPAAFIQHQGSSVNRSRQEGPHAHMIEVSPDNRFALAADLGLDKLLVYRFDPSHGTLAPDRPPFAKVDPGSGPRHFVFHPNGRWVYLVTEIKSTVTAFSYDPQAGALTEFQTISALPKGFRGESTAAEIAVHPSGRFLYTSNRGDDSIALFSIDAQRGTLALVAHAPAGGKTPRNFAIDPTGHYLFVANQDSNNIVAFRIDGNTGRLTPTGEVIKVPSPVSIAFVSTE